MWIDCFNLVQLALSLLAVAETMIVHYIFSHNMDKLAFHIDASCRVTFPVLYLFVTGGMFSFGISGGYRDELKTGGFHMISWSIALLVPICAAIVWMRYTAHSRWQRRTILA